MDKGLKSLTRGSWTRRGVLGIPRPELVGDWERWEKFMV